MSEKRHKLAHHLFMPLSRRVGARLFLLLNEMLEPLFDGEHRQTFPADALHQLGDDFTRTSLGEPQPFCFLRSLLPSARHFHRFGFSGKPRRFLEPPSERVRKARIPKTRPELPISFRFVSYHTSHVVTYVRTFQEVKGCFLKSLYEWKPDLLRTKDELRLRSRSWNRNCGRVAFFDRARCRRMGRAPRLVESARLPACVHWINDCGRDIFPARDRRVNCRQTADDSETYRTCTVNGACRHRRPLWRMSLRGGGEIIARGNAAWWNRRNCRRFSRLRHQETSGFAH